MTDEELRTAAESYRTMRRLCPGEWADADGRCYDRDGRAELCESLADAYLDEHPADDGEALTMAWINSVSGEGPVVNRGYSVAVGPLVYEPRAETVGGPVALFPEHEGKVLLTRGDVRRVASATGEPVTEDTP